MLPCSSAPRPCWSRSSRPYGTAGWRARWPAWALRCRSSAPVSSPPAGEAARRSPATPDPGVAGLVGLVRRGAGPSAAWPRPGRRDRGAVPRGGARDPARRRRHRGRAGRPGWCGRPAGHRRTDARGHACAVHALRVRAGPGLRRDRRRLCQPGTTRRCGRRRRGLRRPGRRGAGSRGRGHPGRDRAEQPAAAASAGTRGKPGVRRPVTRQNPEEVRPPCAHCPLDTTELAAGVPGPARLGSLPRWRSSQPAT